MTASDTASHGPPGIRSLRLGEVELTLVPDGDRHRLSAEEAYGVPASAGWGEYTPPDGIGAIAVMPYSLLVRAPGLTALVDTGGENPVDFPGRRSDFLRQLRELGVGREEVALVVTTHAHLDHVGHNTVVEDGSTRRRPVPAFPNATYFIQKAEADPVRAGAPEGWKRHFGPIEEAGLLRIVTGDEEVSPGITCLATPGHTMGHQSVMIDCGALRRTQGAVPSVSRGGEGRTAIYMGDLAVTKLHLEHLDWSCTWAESRAAERESKRKVIDIALEKDALLIFGHDPHTSWGRLVREAGGGVRVVPWPHGLHH